MKCFGILQQVVRGTIEILHRQMNRIEQWLEIEHAGCFLPLHPQAVVDGDHGEPSVGEIVKVGLVKLRIALPILEAAAKHKNEAGLWQQCALSLL